MSEDVFERLRRQAEADRWVFEPALVDAARRALRAGIRFDSDAFPRAVVLSEGPPRRLGLAGSPAVQAAAPGQRSLFA